MKTEQAYEAYRDEGAELLSKLSEHLHLADRGGRLYLVAEVPSALAEALSNWGADLAEIEPDDEAA